MPRSMYSSPNYTDNFVAHIKLFISLFEFIIIFISGHLFKFHCLPISRPVPFAFHTDLSLNLFQLQSLPRSPQNYCVQNGKYVCIWLDPSKKRSLFFIYIALRGIHLTFSRASCIPCTHMRVVVTSHLNVKHAFLPQWKKKRCPRIEN